MTLKTKASERIEIVDLVNDDALRIRWMPGASTRMVVVFGGVQHNLGGVPMDEFAGSVASGGQVHVVFVNDLRCTWYSTTKIKNQIVAQVSALIQENNIDDVRTIGNSMGGYGAVMFAKDFGASTALAFSPQVSMDERVIAEHRWRNFRDNFGSDLDAGLHSALPGPETQTTFIFGSIDKADMRQAALLPDAEHVAIYKVRGCGHDAVKQFKLAGVLREVVSEGLAGDNPKLSQVLARYERNTHTPLKELAKKILMPIGRMLKLR